MSANLAPLEAEVVALRERVADLVQENGELRRALEPPVAYPSTWGLSPIHMRVLYALERARGATVASEALVTAGWGPHAEATQNDVRVAICRIRSRVGCLGVVIRTAWGFGFALDADSLPILATGRENFRAAA